MDDIPDRLKVCPLYSSDFIHFGRLALPELFVRDAVGVELGVAKGYFSDVLLKSSKVKRLFSVDCWADHHNDREYVGACKTLSKYGVRSVVMRSFFDDVLDLFYDSYFDFIYVDAYAHQGQEGGKLLRKWYPKLKPGGIFSGHDYCPKKWPKTVKAVDDFSIRVNREVGTIPGVTLGNPQNRYPSWYFQK